jgi:hypothetical protein
MRKSDGAEYSVFGTSPSRAGSEAVRIALRTMVRAERRGAAFSVATVR